MADCCSTCKIPARCLWLSREKRGPHRFNPTRRRYLYTYTSCSPMLDFSGSHQVLATVRSTEYFRDHVAATFHAFSFPASRIELLSQPFQFASSTLHAAPDVTVHQKMPKPSLHQPYSRPDSPLDHTAMFEAKNGALLSPIARTGAG